jgi:hypothetical protein
MPDRRDELLSSALARAKLGQLSERPDTPSGTGRRDLQQERATGGCILELEPPRLTAQPLEGRRERVRLARPVGELERAVDERAGQAQPERLRRSAEGQIRERQRPVTVHDRDPVDRLVEQPKHLVELGDRAHVRILSPTWPS